MTSPEQTQAPGRDPCAWMDERLADIRAKDLFRRAKSRPEFAAGAGKALDFSGNDYLCLASDPAVTAAAARAAETFGAGSAASRLVSGTLPCHERIESELAAVKGYQSALVFGSGYLANVGAISCLAGPGDTIFADRLAHASILDGALLSRARLARFRHNDADHLRTLLSEAPPRGRRLVVTESVFSMDGDLAPLADMAEIACRYGAMLMVDEAHAFGVFGPAGAGLVSQAGLQARVHLCMGTLSKALGSYGGFIACSNQTRDWLVNSARSFIFSTALPPASAAAASQSLRTMRERPDMGAILLARAGRFRAALAAAGIDTGDSKSQIVPVIVGDNKKALEVSALLAEAGIFAPAIRPPAVPAGRARLRFSVTLAHTDEDLAIAADAIARAASCARSAMRPPSECV